MTEIVAALLSTERQKPSVAIGGVGGIGKTTLALTVLNDGAVRDRYGNRRFWINCEGTVSAENFLENVIAVLSSSATLSTLFGFPINDVDQDFVNVLDRISEGGEPAVVAFDNLETVFDTDDKLVERMLTLVLQRAGVVVTLRGDRRPSIGNIWSWPASEKTRLSLLPEAAWLFAFEIHAGQRLDDQAQRTIEPVLRQVGGYPLALFLLGRRLAHGRSSIDSLREAWDAEISRAEAPDDTRQTNIMVSIRTSLRSTVMVDASFATETLVLAAHLPPGFCWSSPSLEGEAVNGLPKWLGRVLCDTEGARSSAWAALIRCGLAYTESTAPDRLQLLPPIQEALRSHESIARISSSMQDALLTALDKIYVDDRRVATAFSELDNGEFGETALRKLGCRGFEEPTQCQPRDKPSSSVTARSVHLLATICRNAGFLLSGRILFNEANVRYTVLNNTQDAICMHASKIRLERRIVSIKGQLEDATAFAAEEALLWDQADRPQDVAWTRASACSLRAQIAERDDRLEDAARLGEEEVQLWELADQPQDVAWARASACSLRAELAERDDRLEEAARLRDDEAPLWELANRPQGATQARALTFQLRAAIAECDDRLEEAARLRDDAAPLWELAGRPQAAAEARALAFQYRARIAERNDRLEDAARLRDDEAALWELADRPQDAAWVRALAFRHRARIAEHDDRLEDAARHQDNEALLWELADRPQAAAEARALAFQFRAQIAERDDRLEDAARLRDDEVALWELADRPQDLAWSRAKACSLRAQIAKRDDRLEEAARLWDEEAQLWELADQARGSAWARALASHFRAQIAERNGRLEDAAEYHDMEAEWWEKAGKPEEAVEARHEAEELRKRIAENEDSAEGNDGIPTETTSLLASQGQGSPGASDTDSLDRGDEGGGDLESPRGCTTFWRLCRACFPCV